MWCVHKLLSTLYRSKIEIFTCPLVFLEQGITFLLCTDLLKIYCVVVDTSCRSLRGRLKRSARAVHAQCNYLGVWLY